MAYALLQWPWRSSLEDHLYSFRRYGTRPYDYVNLAVPGTGARLRRPPVRRRRLAHSFLAWLRWAPEAQQRGLRSVRGRSRRAPLQVALPQDEFLHSDCSMRTLTEIGVQHVFSVAPASEWPKIYNGLDRERIGLSRVLTGYLDEETLGRIERILAEGRTRTIDIGYRTVPAKPYLGRHAMLKTEIAEAIRERAEARGLRVDISTRAEDTFYGDAWYRFLASCRYTIGIEGGASVLDRDGSVRACVENRLEDKPGATFAELEAACFPGRDGEVALFAISPRHLEACATRTAQVLVDGEYGGILRPGTHYVALRRDMSNLDEVLEAVAGDARGGRQAGGPRIPRCRRLRRIHATGGSSSEVESELPRPASGHATVGPLTSPESTRCRGR